MWRHFIPADSDVKTAETIKVKQRSFLFLVAIGMSSAEVMFLTYSMYVIYFLRWKSNPQMQLQKAKKNQRRVRKAKLKVIQMKTRKRVIVKRNQMRKTAKQKLCGREYR